MSIYLREELWNENQKVIEVEEHFLEVGCGVVDEVELLFTYRQIKLMQCKLLIGMAECVQKMLTMIVEERKE